MTKYERIKKCPCMKLEGNKILCREMEQYDKKSACTLHILGFDEDGFMTAVCGANWNIVKMYNDGSFEHVGKIQECLATVKDDPDIVLKNSKVMTIAEINKALGCNVIVREYIGKDGDKFRR